jgi:hypothetical protein
MVYYVPSYEEESAPIASKLSSKARRTAPCSFEEGYQALKP